MSGVLVIRYLLANAEAVLAALGGTAPAARVVADDHLPEGTELPALLITKIDRVKYKTIRTTETPKLYSERVQVTPLFKGQEGSPQGTGRKGVDAMLELVVAACPGQRGVINGIPVDSITAEGDGPDLSVPEDALYTGSTDFIVRWVSPT